MGDVFLTTLSYRVYPVQYFCYQVCSLLKKFHYIVHVQYVIYPVQYSNLWSACYHNCYCILLYCRVNRPFLMASIKLHGAFLKSYHGSQIIASPGENIFSWCWTSGHTGKYKFERCNRLMNDKLQFSKPNVIVQIKIFQPNFWMFKIVWEINFTALYFGMYSMGTLFSNAMEESIVSFLKTSKVLYEAKDTYQLLIKPGWTILKFTFY